MIVKYWDNIDRHMIHLITFDWFEVCVTLMKLGYHVVTSKFCMLFVERNMVMNKMMDPLMIC